MSENEMTQEQILEEQKKNCIFCHIIDKKYQAFRVYEDDLCLAILDINPCTKGHVLLLPKEHVVIMPMLKEEQINHLFTVSKHISHAMIRKLGVQGTHIMAANGQVAGQKSPHFMIHVIPREPKDGITAFDLPNKGFNEQESKQIADILSKNLKIMLKDKLKEQGLLEEGSETPPEESKKTGEASKQEPTSSDKPADVTPLSSEEEAIEFLKDKEQLLNAILSDSDEFKRAVKENPKFKALFGSLDLDKMIQILKEKFSKSDNAEKQEDSDKEQSKNQEQESSTADEQTSPETQSDEQKENSKTHDGSAAGKAQENENADLDDISKILMGK